MCKKAFNNVDEKNDSMSVVLNQNSQYTWESDGVMLYMFDNVFGYFNLDMLGLSFPRGQTENLSPVSPLSQKLYWKQLLLNGLHVFKRACLRKARL